MVNNLLLSVILGIVFVGTLYPLFVEAVSGEKLSVGAPYFNAVAGPLALLLAVLVGIGPLLSWRRERRPVLKRLTVPALIGATALVLADHPLRPAWRWLPLLGLAIAPGVAAASIAPLWRRNLRRTPLFTWGMVVAHFGIAVALAGMASDSAFTSETLVAAQPGRDARGRPVAGRFEGVEPGRRARTGPRSRPSFAPRAGRAS